jgi:polyphosphate kinase
MQASLRQSYNVEPARGIAHAPAELPSPAFINRDLSLVEFFRRVLEEGLDEREPLLERLKFLTILSSNLDEFFMIRVSGLKEKGVSYIEVSPDGYSRPDLLRELRRRIVAMVDEQMRCYHDSIVPALAAEGIVLTDHRSLNVQERRLVDQYFHRSVYPLLTPQAVDPTHPFPYISGGSLNLGMRVRPKLHRRFAKALENVGDEFFVRVKIPQFVDRLVPVGDALCGRYILVEDLVTANIRHLVPEADPQAVFQFRITRDADVELREAEAQDLLETMEQNLRQRRFGDVVRLEVGTSMPAELKAYLID